MPPRLARLLAAVVAIALVAGAFALRGGLSSDDDETTSGPRDENPDDGDDPAAGAYRILCDEDLGEAACEAVAALPGVAAVEVMAAGEVLAAYTGGPTPDWDLWLTLDPMAGVLDTARDQAQLDPVTGTSTSVASSPLALLTFDGSPLPCSDNVDWACVVQQVRPGVAVPSPTTSTGMVVVAAGTAGLVGTTTFGREVTDAPEWDLIEDLLDDVETAAGRTTSQQTASMLVPGTASAAVTTAGLAAVRARTPGGQGRGLATAPLSPEVTVGVVLVGLGRGGDDAVRALGDGLTEQTVLDALAEGGWAGGPDASDGLPDPDVIYALQEELG